MMRPRTMLYLFLLMALIGSCTPGSEDRTDSQDMDEEYVDSVLSAAFDRWGYFGSEQTPETDTLLPGFVAERLSDPVSMTWKLDSLHKDPYVSTTYSDDGRIRLLTWLAPDCGTMHRWQSVVCFVDEDGVYRSIGYTAEYGDTTIYSPASVESLHHLQDSLYLAIGRGQMSGGLPFESADLVVLSADGLSRSGSVFQTLDSTFPALRFDKSWYLDHIDEYESDSGSPDVLRYDSATRTLTFPTITNEAGERLFTELYGIGEGISVKWERPIRMRWVDTGFVEISGKPAQ